MRDLSGRVAVVTGGSSGIGLAIARALLAEGVRVVLAARNETTLDSARRSLVEEVDGAEVETVPTDVGVVEDCERLVETTLDRFGQIDLLVNNAGIETYGHFHESTPEEIAATIGVNLTAAIVLSRLVVPHMLERGTGHVVNLSSTAGKHGPPFGTAYGASKAGLISLTESLRLEYHGTGVSASAVCPGFTKSGGMYERMRREIGSGAPPWIGHTTTRRVARATIVAVRRNRPETIVNVPPFRPTSVLAEWFPRLAEWLYRKAAKRWLQKVADARGGERGGADGPVGPQGRRVA